jgi:hypothetical protein
MVITMVTKDSLLQANGKRTEKRQPELTVLTLAKRPRLLSNVERKRNIFSIVMAEPNFRIVTL